MRTRSQALRRLPDEARDELTALLNAVPTDADEDAPEFTALIGWWATHSDTVPWFARWAHIVRTRGGGWLHPRPDEVLRGFHKLARCLDWGAAQTAVTAYEPPVFEEEARNA